MNVVVDASAAFTMLAAPERVAPFLSNVSGVLAPDLIVAELLNARWKLARSGVTTPSLDNVLGLLERIDIVSMTPYASDAAALAQRLDHPVYDCIYAVIAQRERARLITADRRFARKLNRATVDVI